MLVTLLVLLPAALAAIQCDQTNVYRNCIEDADPGACEGDSEAYTRCLREERAEQVAARPLATLDGMLTPGGSVPVHRLTWTRHGLMLVLTMDAYVSQSLARYGEWSQEEVDLVHRRMLKPGDVVVDVGANIGAFTLPLARIVGPTGHVVAFEPVRELHQLLSANLALNGIHWVRTYQAAAGATRGHLPVSASRSHEDRLRFRNEGARSLREEQRAHAGDAQLREPRPPLTVDRVPVLTIDELQLPRLKMLKVDVEGMELDVLVGAASTLRELRPFVYVENDRLDESTVELLEGSLGYRCYLHTPPMFRPDNHKRSSFNVFGDISSVNMLCVPIEGPKIEGLKPMRAVLAAATHQQAPDGGRIITIDNKRLARAARAAGAAGAAGMSGAAEVAAGAPAAQRSRDEL